MRTIDEITIKADPNAILRAASEVENWPKILPHYRWVKIIREGENAREVEMAAWRGLIPVRWTALQILDRSNPRIYYSHTGGPTRGMQVEWSIEPGDEQVRVRIIHDMYLKQPVVNTAIGRWVVGNIFVKYIAKRTLHHMKRHLESGEMG